jgi:hypothetical protein
MEATHRTLLKPIPLRAKPITNAAKIAKVIDTLGMGWLRKGLKKLISFIFFRNNNIESFYK